MVAEMVDIGREMLTWWAMLWGQGDETTTLSEVEALYEACEQGDPMLWRWLVDESWRLIRGHVYQEKKS